MWNYSVLLFRSCNRVFLEDNRCVLSLGLRESIYVRGYFSENIFLPNSCVVAPMEDIPFMYGFLRSLSSGRKKIDDILIRFEKQNHLWEVSRNRDSRRFCERRQILSYRKTKFHANRRNLSWILISDTRHNCLARKRKRALVLSRKWDKLLINCRHSRYMCCMHDLYSCLKNWQSTRFKYFEDNFVIIETIASSRNRYNQSSREKCASLVAINSNKGKIKLT